MAEAVIECRALDEMMHAGFGFGCSLNVPSYLCRLLQLGFGQAVFPYMRASRDRASLSNNSSTFIYLIVFQCIFDREIYDRQCPTAPRALTHMNHYESGFEWPSSDGCRARTRETLCLAARCFCSRTESTFTFYVALRVVFIGYGL